MTQQEPSAKRSIEGLSKKLARYLTWRQIRQTLGPDRFARSRFLYLAGHEGGDASVLKGFGVPSSSQLAVDSDAEALVSFRERYPDVPTFHGSSADVRGCFDVVFLDFYCNIEGPRLAEWLRQGWRCLARKDGSFFAFAVMQGRETARFPAVVAEASSAKKHTYQEAREFRASLIRDDDPEITATLELRQRLETLSAIDLLGATEFARDRTFRTVGRLGYAVRCLGPVARERHLMPECRFTFSYMGEVPMMIHGMRSWAFPKKWSTEKLVKRCRAHFAAIPDRDCTLEWLPTPDPYELLALVEGDGFYAEVPSLLNLTGGTVGAYRAVRAARASKT